MNKDQEIKKLKAKIARLEKKTKQEDSKPTLGELLENTYEMSLVQGDNDEKQA